MIAADNDTSDADGCFRIRDWLASRGQSTTDDLNNERIKRYFRQQTRRKGTRHDKSKAQ
jgi:hypothetical protein